MRAVWVACAAVACVFAASCVGNLGGNGDGNGQGSAGSGPDAKAKGAEEVAIGGMRRLTVDEYRRTVGDLIGVSPDKAHELLPVDTFAPFDNDYTLQTPSEALIDGVDALAGDVADSVVADATMRAKVVGCTPVNLVTDDVCFRSFVANFGRRALRRPIRPDEVESFALFEDYGTQAGDFWVGVSAALRAFLQHPELLYRVEIGTPLASDPAVRQLNDNEVATRLSYLLIGSTPPDWLLDAADAGSLQAPGDIVAAATKLLGDPRAQKQLDDFHAMWLSYAALTSDGIAAEMRAESDALINRVVFEKKAPWVGVLTSPETYVTPELATHYGLPSPGAGPGWVSYAGTGRKGILSHGSFLSAVSKFGDTSPTQRGLLVRTRLFCQTIPLPPPNLNVNVNNPPMTSDPHACKKARYYMSTDPSCSGCHKLMDPIGFGLEAYDASGQLRSTEQARPDCPIDGQGSLEGVGTFNGPGQLADLIVKTGQVEACVGKELYRYAIGRSVLDPHDEAIVAAIVEGATASDGLRMDQLLLQYVGTKAFRFRRDEVTQ